MHSRPLPAGERRQVMKGSGFRCFKTANDLTELAGGGSLPDAAF